MLISGGCKIPFARLSKADVSAGCELLALAFGWPPSVADAMDVDEFLDWARLAGERLKAAAG